MRGAGALVDLVLTGAAVVLWYARPDLGPWPLALVAAGRAWRALTATGGLRRTPFDAPLILFLASAALGAWASFDREAAAAKFWQIVGAVALFDSLACAPTRVSLAGRRFSPVRATLLLLPATIAAYFLLTADWPLLLGKLPPLDPAIRWFASWQPPVAVHRIHPNVAGGLIAALLPLQIAAVGGAALAWPLAGLSALAVVMSGSRGAWLGLAVAGGAWLVWRLWGRRWRRRTWLALAAVLGAAAIAGGALAWSLGPLLFPGGRVELWRNSVDLALDTPFTGLGLGLGTFQMAYSSYVLLLHVGHTIHSHSLPLNIWLEQGLLGLAAFGWLLAAAVRARGGSATWRAAALASLGALLVHGLADDPFYGSRGVVLLFVPLAVIAREASRAGASAPTAARGRAAAAAPALALGATALLALALMPGVRAAFQANLGALAQTRAELAVYRWPEWPIQDALRRALPGYPPPVELGPAIARYGAALALDGGNATANRRLGQILLSRGEYGAAQLHLTAAYARAPEQRATRQLLGEIYAVGGDVERAATLWSTVDLRAGQIPLRVWWYNAVGAPEIAHRIAEAASRLPR